MQALFYLSFRSFVNAVRRALTSGKRMVTLVFAFVYYGWLVFRPIGGGANPSHLNVHFITSPSVIDAVTFGLFALMTMLLMITLSAPRGGFGQADVDVLFPTPISPRAVMAYRLLRDYLATLISPFLLALFGGRFSYAFAETYFGGMKGDRNLAMRMGMLAWFLMALGWVCFGYGLGLLVNRSDLAADRNKKILDTIIGILVVGTVTFIVVHFVRHPTLASAAGLAQAPIVRIVFFTATAACWVVMGTLHGDTVLLTLGFAVLISMSAVGIRMALGQLDMMYDQAAVKGFGSSERRMLRRNNDLHGLMAHRARQGKMKIGFLSRRIGNVRVSGPPALLWKDILLQSRSSPMVIVISGAFLLFMLVPLLALDAGHSQAVIAATGFAILLVQSLGVLFMTMSSATSGYIELLKRVDFQKPLPFRPAGTVFWEVSSKCVPNILVAAFANLVVVIVRPALWHYALAAEFLVLGLSLVVSATVFLVTIAFPDTGDASQRSFRGILIMVGALIFSMPGVATIALLRLLLPTLPLVTIIAATILNVGVAVLICLVGGGLYDAYNPSE